MQLKSQDTPEQSIQQKPQTQSTRYQQNLVKSEQIESYKESHPKSKIQDVAQKKRPSVGHVYIATVTLSNYPNPYIVSLINEDQKKQINNKLKPQILKLSCFSKKPVPILQLDHHTAIQLQGQFSDFIEQKFEEVKIRQHIKKYSAKIGLQILIYFLNFLELSFTIGYSVHNEGEKGVLLYVVSYFYPLICLDHCACWILIQFKISLEKQYIPKFAYYLFQLFMGLSFFKIAPFIYYFNRDQSIKQFSFSEINKYQILDAEDKFRIPFRLIKKKQNQQTCLEIQFSADYVFSLRQLFYVFKHFHNFLFNEFTINLVQLRWIQYFYLYPINKQFKILTTTSRSKQTELQSKLKKYNQNVLKKLNNLQKLIDNKLSLSNFFICLLT